MSEFQGFAMNELFQQAVVLICSFANGSESTSRPQHQHRIL